MKFKKGDRVRIVNKTDGFLSLEECKNKSGFKRGVPDFPYANISYVGEDYYQIGVFYFKESDLEPASLKSFDNPQVGDQYKTRSGDICVVQGVCDRIIFLSGHNEPDISGVHFTKEQLIDLGYTIVQDEVETIEINGKRYKKEDVDKLEEVK